jgi:hypothetical protein
VTLVGAGGVGKTRCALQVGANVLDDFADGVWYAELATASDPSAVPNILVAVFEIQESLQRPMLDTLVAHLENKNLLIVLDNCEHVVAEASKATAAILRAAPKVNILATSREPLGLRGEAVYRLPSLSVPATPDFSAEDALAHGAIALFDARARAVNSHFAITDENAPVVAEVCRRLDGIPLAIELAAARVKVITPKQLAQKLGERFRLLIGGDRSVANRPCAPRSIGATVTTKTYRTARGWRWRNRSRRMYAPRSAGRLQRAARPLPVSGWPRRSVASWCLSRRSKLVVGSKPHKRRSMPEHHPPWSRISFSPKLVWPQPSCNRTWPSWLHNGPLPYSRS